MGTEPTAALGVLTLGLGLAGPLSTFEKLLRARSNLAHDRCGKGDMHLCSSDVGEFSP